MLKRKNIEEIIFSHSRPVSNFSDNRYKWIDIQQLLSSSNIKLQDNDILEVGYTEGWDDGNSFREPHYDLTVKRTRSETDTEYKSRCRDHEIFLERSKQQRKENYLKLRKEFEGELV